MGDHAATMRSANGWLARQKFDAKAGTSSATGRHISVMPARGDYYADVMTPV